MYIDFGTRFCDLNIPLNTILGIQCIRPQSTFQYQKHVSAANTLHSHLASIHVYQRVLNMRSFNDSLAGDVGDRRLEGISRTKL